MIYDISFVDGYEWLHCVTDEGWRIMDTLDGSPRAEDWQPVQVLRVSVHERRIDLPSDFPGWAAVT